MAGEGTVLTLPPAIGNVLTLPPATGAVVSVPPATGAVLSLPLPVSGGARFGGLVSVANLVSYWSFDSNFQDQVGTNHLTQTGGVTRVAGKLGQAADLNINNSQYLSHADPTPLGDEDWTYSLWLKLTPGALGSNLSILTKDGPTFRSYALQLTAAGVLQFFINATTAGFIQSATITDTNWHFLVFWINAGADTINYQMDNGTVSSGATTAPMAVTTEPVRIGANGFLNQLMHGLIDEVGLWRRVLTAQERTALWNGGAGLAY